MRLFQEPSYSNNIYDNRKAVMTHSFLFSLGEIINAPTLTHGTFLCKLATGTVCGQWITESNPCLQENPNLFKMQGWVNRAMSGFHSPFTPWIDDVWRQYAKNTAKIENRQPWVSHKTVSDGLNASNVTKLPLHCKLVCYVVSLKDFDGEFVETAWVWKGLSDSKIKAGLWMKFRRKPCHPKICPSFC